MHRILVVLALMSFGKVAVADTSKKGVFFAPTVLFYDLDYEENGSDGEEARLDLDLSIGYSFGHLMLGGKYYNSEIDYGTNEVTTSAIGAVVGFEHKGFKLLASYNFLNVAKEVDNPNLKYTDGTGIILEMMYICDFGAWGLGPKVSYKNFTFKKQKLDGNEVATFDKREEKEILPYLALYFKI